MQIRINKYISESGFCSRREADKYIEQGAVTLDGKRVEMGAQVSPGQVVRVFGEIISGKAESIIIVYNKPVGIVSTTDPAERDNVINAIGHPERIFPIGRLDKDSQGLLLLTNEGDIVNKILRVNNNHDKEYFVTVDKPVTVDFIKRMQGGIPILGVVTRKCEITQKGTNSFNIVLRQGLNRQIRRMCEYLGYNVTKLQRTRIMHIHLNDLKIGQYRNLNPEETETLYKKIANSVKTEEASAKKGKPARKSSTTPKNSTVTKSQQAKSSPAKKERPASGSNFKSAKPAAGRKTSYNSKSKTQRRSW
ncbi:23S rRNA pseudouridine(2604) synthase RluF [uncultured Parabacteroides sp.]|jgi:23S rRNA pseudouridine2604 synthase|uniref:23S rRNA pseudouridine(2604) synthase RluF n=1 Tax=uncultured Parabacteroides sp. TaxID=512312 RepID=UPI0025FF4A23|nr:23S rRNA pseudouridine(2604) synthase RluF [uncultured Parabacteroides sp.]